jgi:hypothetical protein
MVDRQKCYAGVRATLKFTFGLYKRIYHSKYEDTLTHPVKQGISGCFDIFLAGKDIKNFYGIRISIVKMQGKVASLTYLLSVNVSQTVTCKFK